MAFPHVDDNGNIDYVYAAAVDLRELERTAAGTRLPPSSILSVLDRHQTILAREPDSPQWVGKRAVVSGAMERIQAGADDDVREDVGVDRVRRLWTTVPITTGFSSNLVLALGIPDDVAFAAANDLLRRSEILVVIVIGLTMAVSWSAGRAFVLRPMGIVTDAMRRLAKGDLSTRAQLATALPGLRQITQALNDMAATLEGRERDQAQLALLGRAVQSTHDVVSVTDLENRFTFVNEAFLRTYGYTRDEVIGRTPEMLRSSGVPAETQGQLVHRRKDGTELTISLDTSIVHGDDGQTIGLLRIGRDMSEQLQAAEALRDIEERMRFALTASRVGIWEGNLQTGRFYWSDIQEALHGLPRGSFAGTLSAFFDCIHPDDRDDVRRLLTAASDQARNVDFEYRTTWPDRTEHWIHSSAHYIVDVAGTVVRGAGTAVDVTEQRRLEAQLRQSQKMEAVGQLAGGIAHDFNNMLTAMVGNAELVLKTFPAGDPRRDDIEEIRRAGRRSAELTHQLLAFSRKQILAPRVLHVRDVVATVTPMLRRLLGERIDLRSVAQDRQNIKADAGQLEQVLVNLAVNARDAMPKGGVLTIETKDVVVAAKEHSFVPAGSYALITVEDTGNGMDAATQARVFEPFFTTKATGQGTGLGLATVYGIVKQSDGYIVVSSQLGRGSCFSIYLPHTTEQESIAEAEQPTPRVGGGHEAILLVEDEPAVRDFTTKVLTRHGYRVHAVASGADAIAYAANDDRRIDLLLTDVVLPHLSGRQAAEQIRDRHPETRVLYMSGYTDAVIVHDGILEEGTAFLPKPFTVDALLTHVRQSLTATIDFA